MPWYEVLLPGAVAALLIRFDARFIGPYWTFSEIVSGMGNTDAHHWYERRTLRFAIVRRYLYAATATAVVAIADEGLTAWESLVLGAVLAGLLLWPIVFHGLPWGVLRHDWQLLPLYTGVVATFIGASAFGWFVTNYIREQSDGDVGKWFTDKGAEVAVMGFFSLGGLALFTGSLESLREKKRKRDEERHLDEQ